MTFISPQTAYKRPPGKAPIYPWKTLQIGDSFFVAGKTSSHMHTVARSQPIKVRCKQIVKGGVVGVRVWRIA